VESFVVWVEHEAAAGRPSPGGTVPAVADGRGQDEPGPAPERSISGPAERVGYRWLKRPGGPSRAEAGEPGLLLATKLHVPSLRPGFVPRPRLLGRLDEAAASRPRR
jgi:hypothetical protein